MKFSVTLTAALLTVAVVAQESTLFKRGDIKQKRIRDQPTPVNTPQPAIEQNRTDGKFHDWRDYNPKQFDGKDPYADCVWPEAWN